MWIRSLPTSFVEKMILSYWILLVSLSKIKHLKTVRIYFWIFNFVPSIRMPLLMPVPPCPDYCSFSVSFETRKCESTNFVLFQHHLAILSPFHFHMHFRIRRNWQTDPKIHKKPLTFNKWFFFPFMLRMKLDKRMEQVDFGVWKAGGWGLEGGPSCWRRGIKEPKVWWTSHPRERNVGAEDAV